MLGVKKASILSELRRDLVTGDWVLIAKGGRNGRMLVVLKEKFNQPIKECPFELPQKSVILIRYWFTVKTANEKF